MMDNYNRKARIVRDVDGDTVEALIDLGYHTLVDRKIRLSHVNTPEKGQQGWQEATDFTAQTLVGKDVVIVSTKDDKYGRVLADIYVTIDGKEVYFNGELLSRGLAKPYM